MSPPEDASAPLNGPTSDLDPWQILADKARALAALAEHLRTLPPDQLAPRRPDGDRPDNGAPAPVDQLAAVTAHVEAIRQHAAACRTYTWTRLAEGDPKLKHREIAALWRISRTAVTQAIGRRRASASLRYVKNQR